ncbi:ParB-like chromosome partitioning protein (plasmid) [Deinococcus geothermalis DSM 11300]|uniref:ParB-like chromosome partitioning protein n=1 Tax=Deinococcus geothermalis (strain DSM 11300 / CIP 105573 / AG-3a) TaxID=319795 RepID=A8ZRB4_DEIGD|nr:MULTISPECIES: ParB/RepB/Spo0J family partition protein [Deinococcus]ABW35023.1 ParB-like chromosome partitioning protein [Deinococcus geothermalis DSM 11300]TDE84773.1 ParB/RepB/Spo0J family partition protein [Deinococcus sp. S9]
MTRKGLSAGLAQAGAFGGRTSVADLVSGQPRSTVALQLIDPPRRNPRGLYSRERPGAESLEQLAASIRTHGVLQPLLLRPVGDRFEVVAGERRYLAAREAGLTEIPAIVRSLSDEQAFEMAVIENTQREDMPLVDLALAAFEIAALRTGKPVQEMPALFLALKNGTLEDTWDLASTLQSVMGPRGSSFSNFAQVYAKYLQMTDAEVQALREGQIGDAVARALTRLPATHPQRAALLRTAIDEALTSAEVQERVKALLQAAPATTTYQQQLKQVRQVIPALSRLKEGDARRTRAEALLTELLSLVK